MKLQISREHRLMAAGLAGDIAALTALASDPALSEACAPHGISPLLYERALAAGLSVPLVAGWRKALLGAAGRWMVLERSLASVAEALGEAGVAWAPIKGMDTATRLFERPEERPTSDLDILIRQADLDRARSALSANGWKARSTGQVESYLREEGYVWHASDRAGVSLELHYRLWGFVGAGLDEELLLSAVPDASLGATGLRLDLAHVFVVCAVHAWVHGDQPRLIYWWELRRLAEREGERLIAEVVETAGRRGLQLPVGLAALCGAELWGGRDSELPAAALRAIAATLLSELRLPERLALRRVERRGMGSLSLRRMYLARLLSGRASRMGWKAPWRRVWVHPGTVEEVTPGVWPWWGRRLWTVARGLGMDRVSARLRGRLDRKAHSGMAGREPFPHDME